MTTATAKEVITTLGVAGLSVTLTPELGLLVSPARLLTADLRQTIRGNRDALVEFLAVEAANDAPAPAPTPMDWRQADAAYLLHHFRCPSCCAAGHGRGDRCTTGADLWAIYEAAWSAAQPSKTPGRKTR